MNAARPTLQVRLGFATEKGRRPDNQDYVAAFLGDDDPSRGVVVAVAGRASAVTEADARPPS